MYSRRDIKRVFLSIAEVIVIHGHNEQSHSQLFLLFNFCASWSLSSVVTVSVMFFFSDYVVHIHKGSQSLHQKVSGFLVEGFYQLFYPDVTKWEKIPGLLSLFHTASDRKLGGAWEQGYGVELAKLKHFRGKGHHVFSWEHQDQEILSLVPGSQAIIIGHTQCLWSLAMLAMFQMCLPLCLAVSTLQAPHHSLVPRPCPAFCRL